MLLIIFTKSSLVFCTMDFGMFSPQFCTPQIRFATQKNNREYALAHPRFVILLYTHHSANRMPVVTTIGVTLIVVDDLAEDLFISIGEGEYTSEVRVVLFERT